MTTANSKCETAAATIRHLDEVLGHICARAGVWRATGSEIIDWFKAHSA